jgi:hypothetical protein
MLTSGEMVVSGDQWPIFLYDGYEYDPEDPWKGLFKSNILIYVSTPRIRARSGLIFLVSRHSNTCSRLLVQSTKPPQQRGLVMHGSMV